MRTLFLFAFAGLVAIPAAAQPVSVPAPAQTAAPLDLGFADLFRQPIGPRGLEPTARLQAAIGARVRLVGYMVRREQPLAGRFQLAPRPVTMAEHADGEADDLPASTVTVLLPASQAGRIVAWQRGPLAISGRLEFSLAEDETGHVSWVRLRLDPDALAAQPLAAAAPAHSH